MTCVYIKNTINEGILAIYLNGIRIVLLSQVQCEGIFSNRKSPVLFVKINCCAFLFNANKANNPHQFSVVGFWVCQQGNST